MSTNSVLPSQTDLHAQIVTEFSTLAHKHATVSFWLIGVLLGVVSLAGFGGYLALKSFDAQLARQDAKDAQYQTDRKTFMDTLSQHDAERAVQAQEISDLQAQIRARDSKPLPKPVQDGLKPDATAEQVKNALGSVMAGVPSFGVPKVTPDGSIALSVPQTQQMVSDEVGLSKTRGDLKDTQAIVGLQSHSIDTLNSDLNQCKLLNTRAQADIDGYKKLAKKSKWQKFVSGAEKALLFGAGAYLGHIL